MIRLQKVSTPLLALVGALLCAPPTPAQSSPADRKAGFEDTLRERERQKAEREAALLLADQLLDEKEVQSHRVLDPAWRAEARHRLAAQPLTALEEARGTGALPGLAAQALGNSGSDLIYTPVPPCRIIDTRLIPDTLDPGEIKQFFVATPVMPTAMRSRGATPPAAASPSDPRRP